MNIKNCALGVLSLGFCFAFISCDKEGREFKNSQNTFEKLFPNATNVSWKTKNSYQVAKFSLNSSSDNAAWFNKGGNWFMSETDITFDMLPNAVKEAFKQSTYASWQIDDVDKIEREGVEVVYVIEVEKKAAKEDKEVDLYFSADGVLLKTVFDSDKDYDYEDYIPQNPKSLPKKISSYIEENYPGAKILDIDKELKGYEIEITDKDKKCSRELYFDNSEAWICTKTEIWAMLIKNGSFSIPQAVKTAVEAYAAHEEEWAHYKTPNREFYRVEIEETSGNEYEIDVDLDGNVTKVDRTNEDFPW